MPIVVDIKVEGAGITVAQRRVWISRVTNNTPKEPSKEELLKLHDDDLISTYEAAATLGSNDIRARFQHRYGDDLAILVSEALQAIEVGKKGPF
jgi:hypothetical protein